MKKNILLLSLLGYIVSADTFYIIDGVGDVNLTTYNDKNKSINKYILKLNEKLQIDNYKIICLDKDFKNIEIGIKENKTITLKNDYRCYTSQKNINRDIRKLNHEKFSLNTILFKFKSLKDLISYESNEVKLVSLGGRAGEPIKISKKEYDKFNIKFDFSDLKKYNKNVRIYLNDKEVNKIFFSLSDLSIRDIIYVEIGKENDYEQAFEITE